MRGKTPEKMDYHLPFGVYLVPEADWEPGWAYQEPDRGRTKFSFMQKLELAVKNGSTVFAV